MTEEKKFTEVVKDKFNEHASNVNHCLYGIVTFFTGGIGAACWVGACLGYLPPCNECTPQSNTNNTTTEETVVPFSHHQSKESWYLFQNYKYLN